MSALFVWGRAPRPSRRSEAPQAFSVRYSHLNGLGEFMHVTRIFYSSGLLLLAVTVSATIFGSVRGIIHDPQHRPIQGAMVMLKAKSSDWSKSGNSDANGNFEFNAVPVGDYSVMVASPGFVQGMQDVRVASGTEPVVHLQLRVAAANETVNVSAQPEV